MPAIQVPYKLTAGDPSQAAANLAAIQAAVDQTWTNQYQKIQIPQGSFYCAPGLYLDPPGNLRTNPTNPTMFGFSLELQGAGSGNEAGFGTRLLFTDNSQAAVIMGPGQNMKIKDLAVMGPPVATSRAALTAGGIGIAGSGGNGGISGWEIEDVLVVRWDTAMLVSILVRHRIISIR